MFTFNYAKIMEFVQENQSITIDICKKLFYNTKYGYDSSRRALKSLVKNNYLKESMDFVTNKRVYYINKPLRSHNLLLLTLYACMVDLEAEEIQIRKEYTNQYWKGRSDGLISYKYKGETKILLVEIDMQNKTKIQKYNALYNTGYFQNKVGTFPRLLIINREGEKYKEINNKNIEVIYSNYSLDNLKQLL